MRDPGNWVYEETAISIIGCRLDVMIPTVFPQPFSSIITVGLAQGLPDSHIHESASRNRWTSGLALEIMPDPTIVALAYVRRET